MQVEIRPTPKEVLQADEKHFPPVPPMHKPNVDRVFLRQLRAILRIAADAAAPANSDRAPQRSLIDRLRAQDAGMGAGAGPPPGPHGGGTAGVAAEQRRAVGARGALVRRGGARVGARRGPAVVCGQGPVGGVWVRVRESSHSIEQPIQVEENPSTEVSELHAEKSDDFRANYQYLMVHFQSLKLEFPIQIHQLSQESQIQTQSLPCKAQCDRTNMENW